MFLGTDDILGKKYYNFIYKLVPEKSWENK